jgi:hypothetical protein
MDIVVLSDEESTESAGSGRNYASPTSVGGETDL